MVGISRVLVKASWGLWPATPSQKTRTMLFLPRIVLDIRDSIVVVHSGKEEGIGAKIDFLSRRIRI